MTTIVFLKPVNARWKKGKGGKQNMMDGKSLIFIIFDLAIKAFGALIEVMLITKIGIKTCFGKIAHALPICFYFLRFNLLGHLRSKIRLKFRDCHAKGLVTHPLVRASFFSFIILGFFSNPLNGYAGFEMFEPILKCEKPGFPFLPNNLSADGLRHTFDFQKVGRPGSFGHILPVTAYCTGTPGQNIIEGTVFHDDNEDALIDPGEAGASGFEVILFEDNNQDGLVDGGDTQISTTTTDLNGDFSFDVSLLGPTQNFQRNVSASSDDAEQNMSSGSVNLTSTDLEMVYDGSTLQRVGIRFQTVTIPQGAVILSAVIEFYADQGNSSATDLNIFGQDVNNAATFTTATNNISSRTKTSASVPWPSVPSWIDNFAYESPSLNPIVQEIIDRPGWSSGNSMAFLIEGTSGTRRSESWDGSGGPEPILKIVYAILDAPKYYVIAVNQSTLPTGAMFTTDNVEAATFTALGQTECENYFGYVLKSDVSVVKSAEQTNFLIGDTVNFSLKLLNAGPAPASGIVVTDTLHASLSYVGSSGEGTYNETDHLWTVPVIASGDSAVILIKAIVNTVGSVNNTAQVYSATLTDPDSTPGNNAPFEDDYSGLNITVSCAIIKKNLIMTKN